MEFFSKKGMGLVNNIFTEQDMLRMRGNLGIGKFENFGLKKISVKFHFNVEPILNLSLEK